MDILKPLPMSFVLRMSFLAIAALLFITSCTKEEVNVQETENFTTSSLDGIERSCKTGKHGCFEFVWPISIEFADGTVTEFADRDLLKAGITAWKEANPDNETLPTLVFPLEILDEEGTLFSIASQEELQEAVSSCRDSFGSRGSSHKSCVTLNFPISIVYPDLTTESFNDRSALKTAIRAWKVANADAEVRPELSFPAEVTLVSTDEVVTVNSSEELQAIKEECRNN